MVELCSKNSSKLAVERSYSVWNSSRWINYIFSQNINNVWINKSLLHYERIERKKYHKNVNCAVSMKKRQTKGDECDYKLFWFALGNFTINIFTSTQLFSQCVHLIIIFKIHFFHYNFNRVVRSGSWTLIKNQLILRCNSVQKAMSLWAQHRLGDITFRDISFLCLFQYHHKTTSIYQKLRNILQSSIFKCCTRNLKNWHIHFF